MPYLNYTLNPSQVETSWKLRFHDHSIGLWGPALIGNGVVSDSFTTPFRIYRDGTNTTDPLMRLFSGSIPRLVAYRKTVGYKWANKQIRTEYRDKRGKLRYKYTWVRKRVPVKMRAVRLVSGASSLIPSSVRGKAAFLKPNRLDFRVESNSMKPEVLPVYVEKAFFLDHDTWDGTILCKGLGIHTPSGFPPGYGPSIRIGVGFGNQGFNPCPSDFVLEQQALYALYQKVSSDIPEYMTALAESPELARTLKTIAVEGLKLVREIKKLDVARLAGRLSKNLSAKGLADIWLTWVYSISPTISDIQGTLKVLADKDRIWRSFSTSVTFQESNEGGSVPPGYFYGDNLITDTRIYRYGIILEGSLSIPDYIQKRIINATEVAATAYELVPFSFMLDWVNDIGGYLQACTVLESQKYSAWITRMRKHHEHWTGTFGPDRYSESIYQSPKFEAKRSFISCQREVLSTLPDMPSPIFKRRAKLTDVSSLFRSLNATAIAVGMQRK